MMQSPDIPPLARYDSEAVIRRAYRRWLAARIGRWIGSVIAQARRRLADRLYPHPD